MKNPFHVLDLPDDTSDEAVKKAYLRLVRQYPPERDPDRFQEIRSAFETIASQRDRLRFQLFQVSQPDIPRLFREMFATVTPQRPSERQFLDTLAAGLKNHRVAATPRDPQPPRQPEE